MTRINLIDPALLHTKHLVAEYRELPRVFKLVEAAQARGLTPDTVRIPKEYVMGTGHVTFFYNKLSFLKKRFKLIVAEGMKRGYNFQHTDTPVCDVALHWWGEWIPSEAEITRNVNRIKERMPRNV